MTTHDNGVYAGVDLSLVGTGLAHSGGDCVLIGEKGVLGLSIADQMDTLDHLEYQITSQLNAWRPEAILIEQLDMGRAYGGAIERTVLWWKVVQTLHGMGYPVYTAASAQGKIYATSSSFATKSAVVDAVARTWPHFQTRGNDNLADAAVYCAMITHKLAARPIRDMPKNHTRALDMIKSLHDVPVSKKVKPRKNAPQAMVLDT